MRCRVYWGTHGCKLERGHEGEHDCGCCEDPEVHALAARAGQLHIDMADDSICPGAYPYYGPNTVLWGEDAG